MRPYCESSSFDLNQLYWTSRHFIWLVPLVNLVLFLVLGVVLSILIAWSPRRGRWLASRVLGAFTVLPPIWAAFPRVFGPAGFLLALGVSSRMIPMLECHPAGFRRLVRLGFPVFAGLVLLAAGSLWGPGPDQGVARGRSARCRRRGAPISS